MIMPGVPVASWVWPEGCGLGGVPRGRTQTSNCVILLSTVPHAL